MRKKCLIFLLLWLGAGTVWAQDYPGWVKIPRSRRVQNLDPGVCAWAALETLANQQGVSSLNGLASYRAQRAKVQGDGGGSMDRVLEELKGRKVDFEYRNPGSRDMSFLEKTLANGRAVAISVVDYPKPGDHHAVTLTYLYGQEACYIDCNTNDEWQVQRRWLDVHWTGWAVALKGGTGAAMLKDPSEPRVSREGSQPARQKNLPPVLFLPPSTTPEAALELKRAMIKGRVACLEVLQGKHFGLTPEEAEGCADAWWPKKEE